MDPRKYQEFVKLYGKRLFKLTVEWSHRLSSLTDKQASEEVWELKGRKKLPTKKYAKQVVTLMYARAYEMLGRRNQKRSLVNYRHLKGSRRNVLGHSKSAVLESGSLRDRAMARRNRIIQDALFYQKTNFSGDTETVIEEGKPHAGTEVWEEGNYSGSFKTYRKRSAIHRVSVTPTWFKDVYKRGLTNPGHMLTLSAELVESGDFECYKASWVVNTTGKRIDRKSGYIVRRGEEVAHSPSIKGGKQILRRRMKELREQILLRGLQEELMGEGPHDLDDVIVEVKDSLKAGNCEVGTQSFINQYFPGRSTVTLKELRPFFSRKEVRLASLQAIKRDKSHRLKTLKTAV